MTRVATDRTMLSPYVAGRRIGGRTGHPLRRKLSGSGSRGYTRFAAIATSATSAAEAPNQRRRRIVSGLAWRELPAWSVATTVMRTLTGRRRRSARSA